MEWRWVLQSPQGATLTTLSRLGGASERKLAYVRNSTPQADFKLDLEGEDALELFAALGATVPVLRCFRVEQQADLSMLAVCRFAGPLLPLDTGDVNETDATVQVTARGAFEYLEGRLTDQFYEQWGEDSVVIARDLITQADLSDTLPILLGSAALGIDRDVSYERKVVADAIIELAGQGDFDFEVVPISDSDGEGSMLGRFDTFSTQGSQRDGAPFGFGKGTVANCVSANLKMMRPTNRVYVVGEAGAEGFAEDTTSIAQYGLWETIDSQSDVADFEALDSRARELINPTPLQVVTFQPNPAHEACPDPFVDYWLGDSVPLEVRKGAWDYSGTPRVDGIAIDIDDDGYESAHTLTIAET